MKNHATAVIALRAASSHTVHLMPQVLLPVCPDWWRARWCVLGEAVMRMHK